MLLIFLFNAGLNECRLLFKENKTTELNKDNQEGDFREKGMTAHGKKKLQSGSIANKFQLNGHGNLC